MQFAVLLTIQRLGAPNSSYLIRNSERKLICYAMARTRHERAGWNQSAIWYCSGTVYRRHDDMAWWRNEKIVLRHDVTGSSLRISTVSCTMSVRVKLSDFTESDRVFIVKSGNRSNSRSWDDCHVQTTNSMTRVELPWPFLSIYISESWEHLDEPEYKLLDRPWLN